MGHEISIIRPDREPLVLAVDDSSYRRREIMGEDELVLNFSLAVYEEIPAGSTVTFEGDTYTLFQPCRVDKRGSRNFEYQATFNADYAYLKKYMFYNWVDKRLSFDLTARPWEHIQMIVDNLNDRLQSGDTPWRLGEGCIESAEKLVSYSCNNCMEALQAVADTFETEWEVKGRTIFLRKVEYNADSPLELSYGRGNGLRAGIQRAAYNDETPAARVYIKGGERNIFLSEYGSRELKFPKSAGIGYDGEKYEGEDGYDSAKAVRYVTDGLGQSVAREGGPVNGGDDVALDLTHIYPSHTCEVESVEYLYKSEAYGSIDELVAAYPELADENAEGWDNVQVDVIVKEDAYLPDYSASEIQVPGETRQVVFQSGNLVPREFDINDYNHKERRFKLVSEWVDGFRMPAGPVYHPSAGNTFIVAGVSLPSEYVSEAEDMALKEAVKYLYEHETQKVTINAEIDPLQAARMWNSWGPKIILGGFVRLTDDDLLTEVSDIRIRAVKQYVNTPTKPVVELSNSTASVSFGTTIRELENQEVHTDELHKDSIQFSKRRWRDAKEAIALIEKALGDKFSESIKPATVQTMMMLVGDESLQFMFVDSVGSSTQVAHPESYDAESKTFSCSAGVLKHMTLGINEIRSGLDQNYRYWSMGAYESARLADASAEYYVYAVVQRNGSSGVFRLETSPVGMYDVEDSYYLLLGLLLGESEGSRSYMPLYGFTQVLPGQITTDVIRSADGETYFDLVQGIIGGRITFESGSSGLENLSEWSGKQSQINKALDDAKEAAASAALANTSVSNLDQKITDVETGVNKSIQEINQKLDGVVESYFDDYTPTRSNLPASEWVADGTEAEHIGDTFTNTALEGDDAGKSWRWLEQEDGTYDWQQIADSDASKALALAGQAQATADGKSKTFLVKPTNYSYGDLWIVGSDYVPSGYSVGDLLSAGASSTSFVLSHWSKKVKYTDDTAADNALKVANEAKSSANEAAESATAAQTSADNAQATANEAKANAASASTLAQNAKTAADNAKTAADNAQKDIDDANERLDGWASNGYISPMEQTALKQQLAQVQAEYSQIVADADRYGVTKTSYVSAYNKAVSALEKYSASTSDGSDIAVGTDYANIASYYTAKASILDAIAAEVKEEADKAIADAESAAKAAADADAKAVSAATAASNANSLAEQAKEVANAAAENASTAINDASDAKDVAGNAQTIANDASSLAEEAKNAADTAQGVADKAKADAEAAKTDATNAQNTANAAKQDAEEAIGMLEEMTADGVISPVEKQSLKNELAQIDADYDDISNEVNKYVLSNETILWNAYDNAYDLYRADLVSKINASGNVEAGDLASLQSSYYAARTDILNAVYVAAKKVADDAQSAADDAQEAADSAHDAANSAQSTADAAKELAQQAKELADTVDAATRNLDTKIGDVETGLLEDIDTINARLDGVVENYFEEGTPTLSNYPANEWTTDDDKKNHLGDTYTNIQEFVDEATTPDAGKSWRWTYTDSEHTGYHWHPIADSDAVKALLEASKALAAADGKSRTFVSQPNPPYSVGDLWVQGDAGEIMKCIVARSSGTYVASDWAKASKYTDDTTANEAKELAQQAKEATDALDNDLIFTVAEKRSIRKALKDINPSESDATEPYRWMVSSRASVTGNAWSKVTDASDANYGWFVSNMHTASGSTITKVTIQVNEVSDIEVSIMSRAEGSFDYTLLSLLDTTLLSTDTYSSSTRVATTTRGKQGQTVTHTFKNVAVGTHYITVMYRKDTSGDTAPDNGYYKIADAAYAKGSLGDWMSIIDGKGYDTVLADPAVDAADALFSYLDGTGNVWENVSDEVPNGFRDEVYVLFQNYYKEISAILTKTATSDLDYLANAMRNGKTITDGGLVMTSLVAVGDTEDVASADVEAFMNGSDFASDATHGKLMHALGIPTETSAGSTDLEERAKEAKTRMYEDGYTVTNSLKLEEGCEIADMSITEDGIGIFTGCSSTAGSLSKGVRLNQNGLYLTLLYNTGSLCAIPSSVSLTRTGLSIIKAKDYYTEDTGACVTLSNPDGTALFVTNGLSEIADLECDSISSRKGMFSGLRPKLRKLSSGSLSHSDHTIVAVSGTFYLPSAPMDGQHYRIIHTSTTSLIVRNGSSTLLNILKFKTETGKIYTFTSTTKEIIDMTYCADDATWYVVFY